MENKKMTIFYRLRNLEISDTCTGVQSFRYFGENIEDYEMIYGRLVLDYDVFILRNTQDFYLEKNENGEVQLKMKLEFQESLKKYL
jgi:hypothetical protein